jgi:hypothetical protein
MTKVDLHLKYRLETGNDRPTELDSFPYVDSEKGINWMEYRQYIEWLEERVQLQIDIENELENSIT